MQIEQIYRDNYKAILLFIYHMSGDYHLAEDIAQDVFIKAIENTLGEGKVLTRGWFYTVASNRFFSVMKKRKKIFSLEPDELNLILDNQDSNYLNRPEEYVLGKEQSEEIRKVLLKLCENHRIALVLREYMDLTLPEIAEILGVKETYAKQLLYKARQRFKKEYGGNQNE